MNKYTKGHSFIKNNPILKTRPTKRQPKLLIILMEGGTFLLAAAVITTSLILLAA